MSEQLTLFHDMLISGIRSCISVAHTSRGLCRTCWNQGPSTRKTRKTAAYFAICTHILVFNGAYDGFQHVAESSQTWCLFSDVSVPVHRLLDISCESGNHQPANATMTEHARIWQHLRCQTCLEHSNF